MKIKSRKLIGALAFLWIGFVSAISFMESWLKFKAPGLSLGEGLSIGRIVFSALNKVEITLATTIVILLILENKLVRTNQILLGAIVLILLMQTFWLLPILSTRIDQYISGVIPAKSHLHLVFIIMEIIKVSLLIIYGLNQTKLWRI